MTKLGKVYTESTASQQTLSDVNYTKTCFTLLLLHNTVCASFQSPWHHTRICTPPYRCNQRTNTFSLIGALPRITYICRKAPGVMMCQNTTEGCKAEIVLNRAQFQLYNMHLWSAYNTSVYVGPFRLALMMCCIPHHIWLPRLNHLLLVHACQNNRNCAANPYTQ